MILHKRNLLFSIIFCFFIFLLSFSTVNKFITKAVNKSCAEQLLKINKQSVELGKVRIETSLNSKLNIFIENVLEVGAIEGNKIDHQKIVELIKYFRKENFIEIMGVIIDNEGIFINENDESIEMNQKEIYKILLSKNISSYSINGENYLVIKNSYEDYEERNITTVNLYKDNSISKDILLPIYTELGISCIVDSNGNGVFYADKDGSIVELNNIYDVIMTFSQKNIDAVNKMKLDMLSGNCDTIKYKISNQIKYIAYSPIKYEDLYLCTIVPEFIVEDDVKDIEELNLLSTLVIMLDIILIFGFFWFKDMSKRKKENKRLNIDPVTNGISYKRFNEELKKIYVNNEIKAIYMSIDLDNFKIVNTVLGKECGDQVLKDIYKILEFHIGSNGCYCRKEADEFLACYKYKDHEDVQYIVDSICRSIRHIKLPQNHILIPSVGICYMNNKNISIDNIEINAIIAKKRSKNKINEFYSYFEERNFNEMVDHKNILDDMINAVKNKEFRLLYQPKFDAKTKKVVGAEALIRWTRSDNTSVFPKEFIPIAERTGFITFIDSYVFQEVCHMQAKWIKNGYNIVPISLNISREKLKDQNFLYEFLKIIGEVGLEKEYVQLEITEGATYSYDNVRSNIVDLIKKAGFKVLIDDFGVGYSSLSMLKNIKADYLKIDRSFIMDESISGKSMVKHIAQIAKLFNYKIVAEGVETEEQYNFLKEECDEIQGFYFSKPLEEEEFIKMYLENTIQKEDGGVAVNHDGGEIPLTED